MELKDQVAAFQRSLLRAVPRLSKFNPLDQIYPNLRTLLKLGFFVEAGADKRSFLYVDSVLLLTEA